MDFVRWQSDEPFVLAEGAVVERLRRQPGIGLDPHVANAASLYSEGGRAGLRHIYRSYLDVAQAHELPMLVCTPTWRAAPERLQRASLGPVEQVARDAFVFLDALRREYGGFGPRVAVGGLMGCRGDAYDPGQALPAEEAEEYHRPQARALARAGVDVLHAATLPALSEAEGLARALAATDLPYLLSFVIRRGGTLLDGTPLAEAVARLDRVASRPPHAYIVNCVHPDILAPVLAEDAAARGLLTQRVLGLQANASRRSPEELEGMARLDADDPETFAEAMLQLHLRFGTRLLGGCCGTDDRHIAAIASGYGRRARNPSA